MINIEGIGEIEEGMELSILISTAHSSNKIVSKWVDFTVGDGSEADEIFKGNVNFDNGRWLIEGKNIRRNDV